MNDALQDPLLQVTAAGIKPNQTIRATLEKLLREEGLAAARAAAEKAISAVVERRRSQ